MRRAMRYHLQVLTTRTSDTSPSVLLHFDSCRYLFNCGEGTQRASTELSRRLGGRLKHVFATRTSWDTLGGLPGMILTLADAGSTRLNIHGPPNLDYVLAGTRHFVTRHSIGLHTHEYVGAQEAFEDDNVKIETVCIPPMRPASPPPGKRSKRAHVKEAREAARAVLEDMFGKGNSTEAPQESQVEALESTSLDKPEGAAEISEARRRILRLRGVELPRTDRIPMSLAYVITGPAIPGKMDSGAAKALGVKPGPDLGRLKRGESVLNKSGDLVHAHQCVGPTKPGAVLIILDCPSVEHIPNVLASQQLNRFHESKDPLGLIVHMVGDGVIEDSRYIQWMNKFDDSVQHIVLGKSVCSDSLVYESYAQIQQKLHLIDESIFPLPQGGSASLKADQLDLPRKTTFGAPLLSCLIEPQVEIDDSEVRPLFDVAAVPDLATEFKEIVEDCKLKVKSTGKSADDTWSVCPLGTGSAVPGKYRNVSSTLVSVNLKETRHILFDCGEGTLGQLRRCFGADGANRILTDLECLSISHLHADHHLGVISLLQAWAKVRDEDQKLLVVAPGSFFIWLREYNNVEDIAREHMLTMTSYSLAKEEPDERPTFPPLQAIQDIRAVPVDHCHESYAYVVTLTNQEKIVFSGDCRPSTKLAQVGQGASLVIHEATLDDTMIEEALQKKHCTLSEAVGVIQKMNAKHGLLTHFSQRYPKIPNLVLPSTDSDGLLPTLGIAFDLMTVTKSQFQKLPLLVPSLEALFDDAAEE